MLTVPYRSTGENWLLSTAFGTRYERWPSLGYAARIHVSVFRTCDIFLVTADIGIDLCSTPIVSN